MKRRTSLLIGSAIALLVAAGSGRPGAAYAYSRPACIQTYARGPVTVMWRSDSWDTTADLKVAEHLLRSTPLLMPTDYGVGDHWSVVVADGLTGKELWRKNDVGPLEVVTIPESVWTVGQLYAVKTERWLKDGRRTEGSTLVEITDQATYERLRGITYSLDDLRLYPLTEPGAASVRVTLKEAKSGAIVLSTLLYPESGLPGGFEPKRIPPFGYDPVVVHIGVGGHPTVMLWLAKYLDGADTEKLLSITWEQLDSTGRTLHTEADPVLFTIRAPLKPDWKEGGGGVIAPTGTVEWKPVEGARWYQLTVPGPTDGETVRAILPGDTTSYQFTTPLAPGFHWVNLAAEGGGCRQDWSDGLPIVVDDLPWRGILSPQPGPLTERDLLVQLRQADWIHGYTVELFDAKTGQLLQVRKQYRSELGGMVRFDTESLLPGHSYRIRATATVEVPVPQVEEVTFTYQPPIRLQFKQALQGARVPNADLPLSWDPVPGATSYTVLLTRVSSFANLQSRYPAGSGVSFTLSGAALESGRTYRLALEATLPDGTKRISDPVTFTVQ